MKRLGTLSVIVVLFCSSTRGRCGEPAVSAGQKAPPIALEKLLQAPAGAEASWEQLRGKVVVLEFWATWCGPCVAAMPHLNELADQFKDRPVQFVALTDEQERTVSPFLAKRPIHAWVGLARRSTFEAYHVARIPTTVLVRADGVIDAVTYPTELRAEHLDNLLAGKPSGVPVQPPQQAAARAGELPGQDEHSALFQIIIRPSTGEHMAGFGGSAGGGALGPEVGKSLIACTVRELLPVIYEASEDRIMVKGDLPDGRYDVVAKVPQSAEGRLGQRLQGALESTFGLTSRRENREVDVYVATVGRRDAKGLTPTQDANSSSLRLNPRTGNLSGVNATSQAIVRALERGLARPVVDETKLTGRFDVDLKWDPAAGPDAAVRAASEQLGITLTPAKRPLEVVVIEAGDAAAAAPTSPSPR